MDDAARLHPADLTAADIPAALRLSDEAGWNQTAEDWAVFIAHGRVAGLFTPAGALAASAAALPYGEGFGWISMVLVTAAWRRHGLARRLMGECIDTLAHRRLTPVLDATPAGAEVYRPLGFLPAFGLHRWQGEGGSADAPDALNGDLRSATLADLDRLVAADAAAFGAARRFLLAGFLDRAGTTGLVAEDGFAILRSGRRAMQIGPLVAARPETAARLLEASLAIARGPVFFDLAERWSDLAAWLEARGFRRQRPFRRMMRGRSTPLGDPARLVIAAGPEFG